MPRPVIACFGEALWDVLPRGIFLGGAPLNVAYHLSRHGVESLPISAVGRDFLGEEILRRVRAWGLSTRFLASLPNRSTGTVSVELDAGRNARYRIARRVAWDRIPISRSLRRGPAPAAVVFGSLALREPANRRALEQLFAAWPDTLRVVDLNLRAPFDRGLGVRFAIAHAHILKLNHDELARLLHRRPTLGALDRDAREFALDHGIRRLCVTAGDAGAGVLWDGAWIWEPARPVSVRDTIGAGDSFLGAFLARVIRGAHPRDALVVACRTAEFVATQDGATPHYTPDTIGAQTKPIAKLASPACSMPEIED